MHEMKILQH